MFNFSEEGLVFCLIFVWAEIYEIIKEKDSNGFSNVYDEYARDDSANLQYWPKNI